MTEWGREKGEPKPPVLCQPSQTGQKRFTFMLVLDFSKTDLSGGLRLQNPCVELRRCSSRTTNNFSEMEDAGFIMLMGMTGSGKSTFISRLTGQQPQEAGVGHCLTSSTVDITCHTAQYDETRIVRLIDTPGFDDTTRSNADILNPIANHLATLHRARQRLLGIICLHRITDVRLSGSAIRNFTILQKICGPQNYDKIVLATTMWSDVAFNPEREEAALVREDRLREYWDDMFQGQSMMVPHCDDDSEEEAARRAVRFLIDRNTSGFAGEYRPLQIQHEMVDSRLSLQDTEAGRYVRSELLSANMERLERERAQLQEAVDKARREEALICGTVVTSGTLQVADRPTKQRQQQQQEEEEQSDTWTQTILPSVARSTVRLKEFFFGSIFSVSNDDSVNNNRRDARATSTSDLGY